MVSIPLGSHGAKGQKISMQVQLVKNGEESLLHSLCHSPPQCLFSLRSRAISRPMTEPTLTRRRSDNPHQKGWQIYFGDVRVGTIGTRAGVPTTVSQWAWSCGFYPGLEPGQHRNGAAENFEAAREAFETHGPSCCPPSPTAPSPSGATIVIGGLSLRPSARGEKLDSEIPSTLMRCVCGSEFDSWKPQESYPSPPAHLCCASGRKNPESYKGAYS
ncbi:hypothetical protein [Bradyrhizobium sp. CCGB20]|uniref:hypothetical protein n=1 Tax=Bradyrhizobium sp. CCGB20 TaxID=2949633 RepID=UPI0020B377A9|nr:hypothetical protein [Bradyrhizobium sp. CCGB20]MCP3400201.1 hypothetical protein [Bradyrhizobium sp. CCGB20]